MIGQAGSGWRSRAGAPTSWAGLTLRAPPASSSQAQAGGPASPQRPPRPGVQLLAQFAGCRWVAVWRCTGHRLTCGVSRASSPLLGGAVGWLVRSLSPPPRRPSPAFPSGSSPVSSPSPGLAPSPPARGPLSFTSILVTIPLLSPSASPPLSAGLSSRLGFRLPPLLSPALPAPRSGCRAFGLPGGSASSPAF